MSGATLADWALPGAGASLFVEGVESFGGPWKELNKLRAINASPSFDPLVEQEVEMDEISCALE